MTGRVPEGATISREAPERSRTRGATQRSRGQSASGKGVSVIIPTYNERENITRTISVCLRILDEAGFDPEVLVLDDDSPDYTWQYPHRLFGHDPRVRAIRRRGVEKGLAQSVADGFRSATHDVCVVMDADLQHPPDKLPELVSAIDDGADIAIGSRHAGDGGEEYSFKRRLMSKVAITASRVVLPQARTISDPLAGFFAIRRDVIENANLDPKGYKILLEVLVKGDYETVTEVPYVFRERDRGESNLDAAEIKNFVEHLGQLAISGRGLDRVIDPERTVRASEFAFVGAVGTVVNMIVFAGLTLGADVFYMAAGVFAFVAAVNWNFAGNWLLTFDQPSENVFRQYVGFHLVSLVGFVAYSVTLAVTVQLGLHVLLANGVAILAGAAFNFAGSETAVFPTEESATT